MTKKSFLIIILARAGSKRLKNKNVRILHNKPLVSWSIEAAVYCKYANKVIVSSDSEEILKIAKEYDSNIALKRPSLLAQDETTSIDAVIHAINSCEKKYDYTVLLQPTSPLRTSLHLDNAIESLLKKDADALISVCEMEHSPKWANTLDSSLSMNSFLDKKYINKRSQDLEEYYRINGAIYICKTDLLLKENTFFLKENIFAFKMNREDSVDIDTMLDFKIANLIMNDKIKEGKNNE